MLLSTLLIVILTLALAACAPREAGNNTAAEPEQEVLSLPTWTTESDCNGCHVAVVTSASDPNCGYSLHTSSACIDCHQDTYGKLTEAHKKYATADQPAKLKRTSVGKDICLSCHNQYDIAAATANLTVLTDSSGTTVNPHELPATESHEASVECSTCHKQHQDDAPVDIARSACFTCHHAEVFECGTCHK